MTQNEAQDALVRALLESLKESWDECVDLRFKIKGLEVELERYRTAVELCSGSCTHPGGVS
jgi:hypothetical protein